jgi:lysophospholipase L1-like esterase
VYAVLALVVFVIVIGRQRVLRGPLVVASAAAAAATLCALGATLAVAVLYDGPSPSRAPSATRTPAPAPAPNDARTPYRYVALGDSYAAGEGVRPYESGTQDVEEGGNRCHRSEAAYARLLVLGKPLRLDFRACSGARIAHILDAAQRETPAAPIQVPGPLGDDVSLVTLSIGGNDLAFADLLVHCSFRWNCFTKDKPFRDGLPAAQWLDRELETIPNRLRAVYEGVRGAAPRARILVLGYPYLFPDGRLSLNVHCGLASGLWDAAERREIRALGLRLNEAAEGATAGLAEFVDVAAPFTGHEPCGRERDWVEAERIKARKIYEGSFHPNADGQAAFARLVACHLFLQPPVGVGPEPSPTSEPAETMDDCLAAG